MPRPPDQPPDTEPLNEKRLRGNITVGEVYAREADQDRDYHMVEVHFDADAVIAEIGPERWEELRRRRDEILAELRRRDDDGG